MQEISLKQAQRRPKGTFATRIAKSAFDDIEGYELTELGSQFVHYAMSELTPKIGFASPSFEEAFKEAETATA